MSADVDVLPGGAWLTPEEAALVQRFDPSGPLDTIGFFAARFVKDGGGAAAVGAAVAAGHPA